MATINEQDLQAKLIERMGSSIIYMISHVSHLAARKSNRLLAQSNFSLQIEQFPVLFMVYFSGDTLLSQQEIADMLQKDKSGIQRSIRTLERDGYLRIMPDSLDRRKNLIRLTPAGKLVIDQAIQLTQTLELQVTSQLTQEELDTFLTINRKILHLLAT